MWHDKQLRQVCRARKAAKAQQHHMMNLALEGIVALTLHTATGELTIAIERGAGAQVVGTLHEVLRERRQGLKT